MSPYKKSICQNIILVIPFRLFAFYDTKNKEKVRRKKIVKKSFLL